MQISGEQYYRFITNQCSEEERLLLASYFRQHPELMEQWVQSESWEQFQNELHLHPAFSARMREKFLDHIRRGKSRRRLWYNVSVAAVLSGLVLLPVAWILVNRPQQQTVTAIKPTVAPVAETWQVINNETDTVAKIVLYDGSVVKLHSHGTLRFKKDGDEKQRNFFLQGAAHFTVTKDTARPFTVYAGGVATTALGTAFTVKTVPGNNVQVRLHQGKVVVRAGTEKEVYLKPGDDLVMNAAGKFSLKQPVIINKPEIKKDTPPAIGSLSFSNTPLTDVLQQLRQQFGADIRYDPEQLKDIYITASFSERDTLTGILDIICVLNNLRLQKTDGVFVLSR